MFQSNLGLARSNLSSKPGNWQMCLGDIPFRNTSFSTSWKRSCVKYIQIYHDHPGQPHNAEPFCLILPENSERPSLEGFRNWCSHNARSGSLTETRSKRRTERIWELFDSVEERQDNSCQWPLDVQAFRHIWTYLDIFRHLTSCDTLFAGPSFFCCTSLLRQNGTIFCGRLRIWAAFSLSQNSQFIGHYGLGSELQWDLPFKSLQCTSRKIADQLNCSTMFNPTILPTHIRLFSVSLMLAQFIKSGTSWILCWTDSTKAGSTPVYNII